MEDLYKRTIELLGKGADDPILTTFVRDIGEPAIERENQRLRLITFPDHGLWIEIWKKPRRCKSIAFHIATAIVEAGNMRPYSGDFPNGIAAEDSREQVQAKLAMEPERSELPGNGPRPGSYRDEYTFSEISLSFLFDKVTAKM